MDRPGHGPSVRSDVIYELRDHWPPPAVTFRLDIHADRCAFCLQDLFEFELEPSTSKMNLAGAARQLASLRRSRRSEFAPQCVGRIVRGGQQWNRSARALVSQKSGHFRRRDSRRYRSRRLPLRPCATTARVSVVPSPVRSCGRSAMGSSRPSLRPSGGLAPRQSAA